MNETVPAPLSVGIALGSNLDDRIGEITAGFAFLKTLSVGGRMLKSSIIETAPVDCPPGSPPFQNAVAEILIEPDTWPPLSLLARLQDFEVRRGRARNHGPNSARPLDLDLLYYGDRVVNEPRLILPHPRISQRQFVLFPLSQIRPELILPGQKKSIRDLLVIGV